MAREAWPLDSAREGRSALRRIYVSWHLTHGLSMVVNMSCRTMEGKPRPKRWLDRKLGKTNGLEMFGYMGCEALWPLQTVSWDPWP